MTNSTRDAFLAAVKPLEERIEIKGVALVVKQLPTAADVEAFRDQADSMFKFVVRCTFDMDGRPLFTDDDIPTLKSDTAKALMVPLIAAVSRVNGMAEDEAVKNSGAGPAAS